MCDKMLEAEQVAVGLELDRQLLRKESREITSLYCKFMGKSWYDCASLNSVGTICDR